MSVVVEGITETEVNDAFAIGNGFAVFFFDPSVNALKYKIGQSGSYQTLATGVTSEEVEDIIGAFIQGSADIGVNYDDPNNQLLLTLLNTSVTPGTYGGANIPIITVDAKGRVTDIQNGPSLVLGDNFFEESSQPASPPSNGTATLQNAYEFTTPNLQAGKYKFEFNFYCEPSSTSANSIYRALVDGQRFSDSQGVTIDDVTFEGKDVGSDIRRPVTIKGFFTFATSGSRTITLQHAAQGGSGTIVTHFCQVETYRISP